MSHPIDQWMFYKRKKTGECIAGFEENVRGKPFHVSRILRRESTWNGLLIDDLRDVVSPSHG
jgi:hypothetical protein